MALRIPVQGVSAGDLRDGFGDPRSGGRSHKGLDIFAPNGTPVLAAMGGTVVKAGDSGGLGGIRVWVQGDDGLAYYYAHLADFSVEVGQKVTAGQKLGGVGTTGNAQGTSPHLHFSINGEVGSENPVMNPYEALTNAEATRAPSQQQTDPTAVAQQTPKQGASRVAVGVLNQLSQIAQRTAGDPATQQRMQQAMQQVYRPQFTDRVLQDGTS